MLCHNSIFSYKGSEKPWLSTQCRLNAGRLLRLSHRITIYTPIEFSYILSQLCHKFSFLIWTNRHVKHYVFFPIVRFHEKLFFFSLQKIFICRVVTKIAYVRENTPQNIDSIKSYPTSSSGTTFFAINYLESGGRLIHRAPTITPNMSNKHFQTSTHRCFISHPASWKIFFTNHKTSFKSSAATKMTGNRYISNNNSNIRLHFSEHQASKQGCLSP